MNHAKSLKTWFLCCLTKGSHSSHNNNHIFRKKLVYQLTMMCGSRKYYPRGRVVRWFSKAKICKGKVHCMNQNGILGWWGEFGQKKPIVVGIWIFSKQFYVTIWLWAEDFCEVISDEGDKWWGWRTNQLSPHNKESKLFNFFL